MFKQQSYLGISYGFEWTQDAQGEWYAWDYEAGNKAAQEARDAEAKKLKAAGWTVKKSSDRNQLISRGGIGSGKPHIELHCNAYILTAWKA